MPAVPSTDDIILDRSTRGTDCRRCVDWAIGMLAAGYDADYLGRLAGQLPPFDLVSISVLRDKALEELGIEDLSDETMICCAVANLLRQCSGDTSKTRQLLQAAMWLYTTHDIRRLQSLYLLYYGIDDLEQFGEQWYVDGMNRTNAVAVTERIVAAFVERHATSSAG